LVALDNHLEAISSVAMIAIDAIAPVPSVIGTRDGTWSIHASSVPTTPSNLDLNPCWWRRRRRIFCLHARNLQIHAPSTSVIKACDTDSVAVNIDVETVSSIAVVGVDAVATVTSIRVARDRPRGIDALCVPTTVPNLNLDNSRWRWRWWSLHTLNLQIHAPASAAVSAAGADLIAFDDHLEGITSIAMIRVDALAPVPGIHSTLHRAWSVHTPPVAAASSNPNIHCRWRRRSRLRANNLQVHTPASAAVQAPGAHLVAININVKAVSGSSMITIDAYAPIPCV
jgi:hypothetical protein